MRYLIKKQKMDYLLEMIEKERCYSIDQVSRKFDCSTRTVKRMISELKEEGHNINYCPISRKFFKR